MEKKNKPQLKNFCSYELFLEPLKTINNVLNGDISGNRKRRLEIYYPSINTH